jgi:hypothetical protein
MAEAFRGTSVISITINTLLGGAFLLEVDPRTTILQVYITQNILSLKECVLSDLSNDLY